MAKTAKKRVLVERQGGVTIETSNQRNNPIIDDRGIAFAVYILYFLGYVTGITTLIGVMIAYLQNRSCSSVRRSLHLSG